MTNECVNAEQIADVLELSSADPLRRHVEQCPRCSSLLESYQAFLLATPSPSADTADAEARLMDFLHQRIGAVEPAPPSGEKPPGNGGFFARLKGTFWLRPAWVAAAALVVVAAVALWQPWEAEPPALRSTSAPSLIATAPPQTLPGGAVRLAWEAAEGADAYQVVVYNEDLVEIARLDAGSETTYALKPDALPDGAPAVVLCRIAALQDGDEIAESAPIAVQLP